MRTMRSLALLLVSSAVALGALGCAPPAAPPGAIPKCPESQRCLTAPECRYEPERRCELCRCASPTYTPTEASPPK